MSVGSFKSCLMIKLQLSSLYKLVYMKLTRVADSAKHEPTWKQSVQNVHGRYRTEHGDTAVHLSELSAL